MKSKWGELKEKAIEMRREGISITSIQMNLEIPRSTLCGWFRNIQFTESELEKRKQYVDLHLAEARRLAGITHTELKKERIALAHAGAEKTLSKLLNSSELSDEIVEVTLAMLYLGEGAKADKSLRLGNSNPMILRFYVDSLEKVYGVDRNSFRIALNLRADQDENTLKKFWSEKLDIPIENFTYCIKDARTVDRPTYSDYYGVCLVDSGHLAIQRRLMHLAELFCKRVIDERAVSSIGRAQS